MRAIKRSGNSGEPAGASHGLWLTLTGRNPTPLGAAPRLLADTLTHREREIAMLAADGLSSRAIAERLYVSVRTVDNHLGRIYTKLGVSSQAEPAELMRR